MEQDGRAYIILNRAASGVMRHDDFDILVNDSRIDTIKEGEEKTLALKPGWNRISLSRGLMKSKPLVFKMSDGMIINLECGCSMNRSSCCMNASHPAIASFSEGHLSPTGTAPNKPGPASKLLLAFS